VPRSSLLTVEQIHKTYNIRKRDKIENEILFQFAFRISFSRHAKALTSAAEANKHQKLSPAWIFKLACAT